MSDPAVAWEALTAHLSQIHTLSEVRAVLAWDQQTHMPPKGAAARGQQHALLGELAHARSTDPRVGRWLEILEARQDDLDEVQKAGIRNIRRSYERATRVPVDLVTRTAQVTSEAFTAWMGAREANDFDGFAPWLERIVALNQERACCIDPGGHPYEVLLQDYDPGTTLGGLQSMFLRLRDGLGELLTAVGGLEPLPTLGGRWDEARQLALHREVCGALGYDLRAGGIAQAQHPFTVRVGTGDVRITTHVYEDDLLHGLGGTIHETGHAMYEQGLPHTLRAAGVGTYASLGLHESQSRFWENFIGRSRAFSVWLAGVIARHFPEASAPPDRLYRAANRVAPGLIRVAADEVTYNLHIIVRFELEVALLDGTLAVRDLPRAWEERYERYLGVRPTGAVDGVLQDVHWSGGNIGYFPSYTLGNLYAASLGRALEAERPGLWAEVERGEFGGVLGWLRERVHGVGHRYDAPEIVRRAVGERDAVGDLLDHVWARHGALYGVQRGAATGARH